VCVRDSLLLAETEKLDEPEKLIVLVCDFESEGDWELDFEGELEPELVLVVVLVRVEVLVKVRVLVLEGENVAD